MAGDFGALINNRRAIWSNRRWLWKENALWRRALELAHLAIAQGFFFVLEHPKRSRAWSWPETQKLLSTEGVKLLQVDWCASDRGVRPELAGGGKARLLSNAPWLERAVQRSQGAPAHARVRSGAAETDQRV